MTSIYHDGSRELQDRFDTRRLADRLEERVVHDAITDSDKAFIEARDCFFLATTAPDGFPTVSHKGGDPGFVRILDPHTLAFPNYDGNGMYLSLGNALADPRVGLLFIDFERPFRIRVDGTAAIDTADPLLPEWPGAQLVVRVAVRRVLPNCPRYIHRRERVEASPYVPRPGVATPIPDWKRAEWARDVLPAGDPATGAS